VCNRDAPQYTAGDVVELYLPHTGAHRWIEVEKVLTLNGVQHLQPKGIEFYFCECLVKVDSLATPQTAQR
jgi:hypothetical protein